MPVCLHLCVTFFYNLYNCVHCMLFQAAALKRYRSEFYYTQKSLLLYNINEAIISNLQNENENCPFAFIWSTNQLRCLAVLFVGWRWRTTVNEWINKLLMCKICGSLDRTLKGYSGDNFKFIMVSRGGWHTQKKF